VAVAVGKEKEGGDGILDEAEVRVQVDGGAEGAPSVPDAVDAGGAGWRDAMGNSIRDVLEVALDSSALFVRSHRKDVCGNRSASRQAAMSSDR